MKGPLHIQAKQASLAISLGTAKASLCVVQQGSNDRSNGKGEAIQFSIVVSKRLLDFEIQIFLFSLNLKLVTHILKIMLAYTCIVMTTQARTYIKANKCGLIAESPVKLVKMRVPFRN